MSFSVKEIYYTLQGEGAHTGRPAVFLRFAGCNLWSGREADRQTAACSFCDTDFLGTDGDGGGVFETADALAAAVAAQWPAHQNGSRRFVVCTGGEPLLQLNSAAVAAMQRHGFEVAIETNGTRPVPPEVDWVCVSPKAGGECVIRTGDELKLVFPQEGSEPERYQDWDFTRFFLQPMYGGDLKRNTELAIAYCLEHPQWELSVQTHKVVGIR